MPKIAKPLTDTQIKRMKPGAKKMPMTARRRHKKQVKRTRAKRDAAVRRGDIAVAKGLEAEAIRGFVGIDPNRGSAPDATTLLKFRRLLEKNELTHKIFETINGHLAAQGLMMREGTIVDATLIAAPPSTKNKDKKRDPEMHQSKKGNDWHFGLKAHIGVDVASGLVHTMIATAGNASDLTQVSTAI